MIRNLVCPRTQRISLDHFRQVDLTLLQASTLRVPPRRKPRHSRLVILMQAATEVFTTTYVVERNLCPYLKVKPELAPRFGKRVKPSPAPLSTDQPISQFVKIHLSWRSQAW